MRIIKKGKDVKHLDIFHGVCLKCSAKLEADKSELQIEYDQREQGEFGRAKCPCCNYDVIFYPLSS